MIKKLSEEINLLIPGIQVRLWGKVTFNPPLTQDAFL
jgi:hypothetical protein